MFLLNGHCIVFNANYKLYRAVISHSDTLTLSNIMQVNNYYNYSVTEAVVYVYNIYRIININVSSIQVKEVEGRQWLPVSVVFFVFLHYRHHHRLKNYNLLPITHLHPSRHQL